MKLHRANTTITNSCNKSCETPHCTSDKNMQVKYAVETGFCSPHLCVGFLFLVVHSRLPPPPAASLTPNLYTHNLLTHSLLTHNLLTHTTCPHTTYSQTAFSHTTYSHTACSHTPSSHTTYSHTHATYSHTQLTHTQLAHTQPILRHLFSLSCLSHPIFTFLWLFIGRS